ncbi:MAG TPA: 1-(5-phosphoribosyl)-5-[(5-phosphoribosylamino)methylideneamino]imidazole-4-carboxamide isomerase [Terriglobia bacterium]|nr:1-(5-phosphoribosyl)-5-[(5-phosphoribosylamino)methylideneamino]imidazole-4-carboxamide isomerase [Terriglobia bacterium]
MNIYPAIDILNGKAVRLLQGRAEDATVYGDPLEMAHRWISAGATWLHIVDLDGAFEGDPKNRGIVRHIARSFPETQIQLGGGIRGMEVLEDAFDAGVARAVLGTSLVNNWEFAGEALRRYRDRIVLGIDARDSLVKVAGWAEETYIDAISLAHRMEEDFGAERVIYTDISRDGALTGHNIEATRAMIRGTGLQVIASGGVATIDDLRALAALREPRLDGVIVGKALYEGHIAIEDALSAAPPRTS